MTIVRVLLMLGAGAVAGAIFWPVYDHPDRTKSESCFSNLKQVGLALVLYANDNNDRFGDRDHWMDDAMGYTKHPRVLRCPEIKQPGHYGYAYNSKLSKQPIAKFDGDSRLPLVYDSVNEAINASDPFTSLPRTGRHQGRSNIVFTDAHVEACAYPHAKD